MGGGRETDAVVPHPQFHAVGPFDKFQVNPRRPAVLDGVMNRLLRNPVKMTGHHLIGHHHGRGTAKDTVRTALAGPLGQILQRLLQPVR